MADINVEYIGILLVCVFYLKLQIAAAINLVNLLEDVFHLHI